MLWQGEEAMFTPVYRVTDKGDILLSTKSFSVSYDRFREDEEGNIFVVVKSDSEPELKLKLVLSGLGNSQTPELEIKNKAGLGLIDIRLLQVKIKKFKNGWGAKVPLQNGRIVIKGDIPKYVKLQLVRAIKM
jgi:hypothetical protein